MTKDVRDKLLRVSELEEQRDALKTKINTAEDAETPDAGRRSTGSARSCGRPRAI